jgi:hypothetical protein
MMTIDTQTPEKYENDYENAVDTTVSTAQEKTEPFRQEMREKGNQLVNEAKSAAEQAGEQAKSALSSQKDAAARQLHGLANSLRQTSTQLRQQDQGASAGYSQDVANKLDRASDYLEEHNLEDLFHDAEGFARRQPELFIGGAFTLGLLAARFLRSSKPQQPDWRTYSETRYGNGGTAVPVTYHSVTRPGSHDGELEL